MTKLIAVLLSALLLVGCGGGNQVSEGTLMFADRMRATSAVSASPAAVTPDVTSEMTLDWAEYKFPDLFPKALGEHFPSIDYRGVTYSARAYSGAWGTRYLGITSDGRIFGLGDFTGELLQQFDDISHWAPQVLADKCNVSPDSCLNLPPVADAGPLQNVITGTVVMLDGSASSDGNGDQLTYRWSLTSKPVGSAAALASATSAKPTFTADLAGTYVASLTVNDGKVNSTAATVTVTAAVANVAPVANAGLSQYVVTGATVTVDGSASTDANNDPLTYSWSITSKPAGSAASMSFPNSVKPSFFADAAGIYVASLVVNDGKLSSASATVTISALTPAERVLKVAFIGCKVSDVPGLSMVNGGNGLEWTANRIASWVNDAGVGFKSYLRTELFQESDIGSYVEVRDWKDIGSSSKYAIDSRFELWTMKADCINAHSVSHNEFDIIGMFFNVELGGSYGGGRYLYLSKWVNASVILHELMHALTIDRLNLSPLGHSNMSNIDLVPVGLDFANTFSVMYGNGQYNRQDRMDENPEFGPSPAPLTTANRWMTGVLKGASICRASYGVSKFSFRAWGEAGSSCLLLNIEQKDGKIITIELQPTISPFQTQKLEFLDGVPVGSRYLIGVRYPTPVSPNGTDWAAIFNAAQSLGWVSENILFKSGQVLNIGNASIAFGEKSVEINVTR